MPTPPPVATDAPPAAAADAAVQPGALYVVATPIGNLGDLSPRAAAVLGAVDRICAEDTRTTGTLLAHLGLRRPMTALHEHNEDRIATGLVALLREGRSLALVSDAGTPLVSDPGFALVRAARAAGQPVFAVPGPCAAVAALSISGLPSDSFVFAGFLPPKAAARRERLRRLGAEPRTVIVYESSHRIGECLDDVVEALGPQRRVCLARELTKRFEESRAGTAAELRDWQAQDPNRGRGEFVLLIEGETRDGGLAEGERVLRLLLPELPLSAAARLAAEITGAPRRKLYDAALRIGGSEPGQD
ncbi:MAG: 16S rRNA (cytidine(1402)-2'-O)-methyltransferase [Nevskia sp.]|nr:16S rRNA (cytidine(1402)-2'-O)-methyltransferase [Nevskia sp.]